MCAICQASHASAPPLQACCHSLSPRPLLSLNPPPPLALFPTPALFGSRPHRLASTHAISSFCAQLSPRFDVIHSLHRNNLFARSLPRGQRYHGPTNGRPTPCPGFHSQVGSLCIALLLLPHVLCAHVHYAPRPNASPRPNAAPRRRLPLNTVPPLPPTQPPTSPALFPPPHHSAAPPDTPYAPLVPGGFSLHPCWSLAAPIPVLAWGPYRPRPPLREARPEPFMQLSAPLPLRQFFHPSTHPVRTTFLRLSHTTNQRRRSHFIRAVTFPRIARAQGMCFQAKSGGGQQWERGQDEGRGVLGGE